MRVHIKFKPERFLPGHKVNKHTVQGVIYSLLDGTEFSDLHSRSGFKFFTYSDIFPPGDFYPGKEKNLVISSPNPKFINELYSKAKETEYMYLSDGPMRIVGVKKFSVRPTGKYITGSPVVVQEDNATSTYFSFRRGGNLRFFMDRLKENALKKYNAYYDDELTMDEDLFDFLQFKKEVSIVVKKDDKSFVIIGTMWEVLQKRIPRGYGRFYRFITDCGIGEKNSLGFGFLNVISE